MQPLVKIISFCRCFKQRGTEAFESTGRCSRKSLAQGHNGNSAETQPQHSPPARIPEGWVILNRLFHSHNASSERRPFCRMSTLKPQWITNDSTDLRCPLNTLPFWFAFLIVNLEWSGVLMAALVTSGRKEVEEERLSGPDPLKWLVFVCLFFQNLFRPAQALEMTSPSPLCYCSHWILRNEQTWKVW